MKITAWLVLGGLGALLGLGYFQPGYALEKEAAVVAPAEKTLSLPAKAVEVAPNLYFLGEHRDVDGAMVQGYAYIHRKDSTLKSNGAHTKPTTSCYGFMARGAKWKQREGFVVNGANNDGILMESVVGLIEGGIGKWERAAGKDIIGTGTSTTASLVADTEAVDGLNEVYFGELDPGTIGLTIVWGIFGGPTQNRELREWDQVYNTYYEWSAETSGVNGKMDLDNIATHELGHTMGLDDLYTSSCTQETMYGYGAEGETYKRDLNAGDIAGIKALYP